MTDAATETRTVVVEREIPHAPEKIWRALTQPHLIEEWLMKNDFEAKVEPHRVFRRPFRLSHAATAGSSSVA